MKEAEVFEIIKGYRMYMSYLTCKLFKLVEEHLELCRISISLLYMLLFCLCIYIVLRILYVFC